MPRQAKLSIANSTASLGFEAKLWLFEQIRAKIYQSRTLATLRDTLLPKLLSGEISPSSS